MRIDFVRHGEVPGNREGRYVGLTEESLTPEGREAAGRLHLPQPEMVFASPRLRCVETAAILYPRLTPVLLEGLAECRFGEFEYKNYRELDGDPRYQAWIDSGGIIGFPGGESREEFQARCLEAFYEAVARAEERDARHIAFVVHGGTIMAVMDRLSFPHRDYFCWQRRNLEGVFAVYDGCTLKYQPVQLDGLT